MQQYPLDAPTLTRLARQSFVLDGPELLLTERHADAQVFIYNKTWNTLGVSRSYIIGAFDGMHTGHQSLVHDACVYARTHNTLAVAVTFDPDPSALVADVQQTMLLATQDRVRALAASGVDAVVVLKFTPKLMHTSYQDFCSTVLEDFGHMESLHVGVDFVLGAQAQGTVDMLKNLGAEKGFAVVGHPLVEAQIGTVTATRIRSLLKDAKLATANELLGRWHFVRGTVEYGRGKGRSFGFPTANVRCDSNWCFPAQGVYACMVRYNNCAWPAAVNVGAPPTFLAEQQGFLEAHLLGFEGNLYGKEVEVSFIEYLRPSRKFSSLEELEKTVVGNIQWVATNIGNAPVEVY
ncbi:riboflavin biosynthesis protein RibF [Atopobium fossor]|uniref:riboflavin biosynthesis protein RibF n=1 Tax=Atopobium fossor TaxID=39487 RepID=UPI0004057435|nr:riboflavin biosynthesis protein RibF [Atopobium fossor]